MIGYIAGKFLATEDNSIIVDAGGVGYSVLVPAKVATGLTPGAAVELFIHTNLRENALELFGFQTLWEKKVFQALTSVSGVGPRTALAVLGGLDPETVLAAIVREDRATLTSVSGIGKKTAERLLVEITDKARKLLAERPRRVQAAHAAKAEEIESLKSSQAGSVAKTPPQGASASAALASGLDVADLWNEALAALVNLGYREADAIAAIKMASGKAADQGAALSLEKLIMSSLQLMSRGL